MELGLSMIIKNEENNLKNNLGTIYDLFDDVVVVDTGSTDSSLQILQDLGIKPLLYDILDSDKRLIKARNFSIESNKCKRVMVLDGDEHISRDDIKKIKSFQNELYENIVGYFIKRNDYRYNKMFEDYKMCLINKEQVKFLFSAHACPQTYIRDNKKQGLRMNGITLNHYPEKKEYRKDYIYQLEQGIKENPGCLRFYRFLGYYYFKNNKIDEAKKQLEYIVSNINDRFPVEILNSIMVLSSIYQLLGENIKSFNCILLGLDYYEKVKHDFEVKINFRLHKRFLDTKETLILDPNISINPYEFAY